ncbi:MAG: phospholipid/glycerol acyltransferase [Hyphomicrobiales bacterium]|nr:phospholipid/glycerol acyltransferase [Hyphomicrobiales bacterium]
MTSFDVARCAAPCRPKQGWRKATDRILALVRGLHLLLTLGAVLVFVLPAYVLCLRWRPRAFWGARVFAWAVLRALRVRVSASGHIRISARALLVANHVSWLDIIAIMSVIDTGFLAKREVGNWPIVGLMARIHRTIFIDRQRRTSVVRVNDAIAERLRGGHRILVFPEGTTTDGDRVAPFHAAHFAVVRSLAKDEPALHASVHPGAISYSHRHAAWRGDQSLASHVAGLLRSPSLECRLTFLGPEASSPGSDYKEMARRTEKRIAFVVGCPGAS